MDVHEIVHWSRLGAWASGGLGAVLLLWAVALWRPGRARRFCPGPRERWWRRMRPMRLVMTQVCGYDLTGLPGGVPGSGAGGGGEVVCPECGGRVGKGRRALRRAWRGRPGRLGVALVVLAGVVACAPMLKTRSWQRLVPTTVLIGVKRAVGTEWMPTRLRRELENRLDRGGLYAWQERFLIPGLQRDLRSDRFERNAVTAIWRLRRMGAPGWAAIERSLLSHERQEHQLAAEALRRRCFVQTWKGRELVREPSEALLRATAEGMSRDEINWRAGMGDNAYEGFGFLLQFPDRAAPYVAEGLVSEDIQRRLLSAGLAVQLRRSEMYHLALPILVAHVADNAIRRDAKFAVANLALMKHDAVHALERMKKSGDRQQRAIAELLLVRLQPGARGWADERINRVLEMYSWPPQEGDWVTLGEQRWSTE